MKFALAEVHFQRIISRRSDTHEQSFPPNSLSVTPNEPLTLSFPHLIEHLATPDPPMAAKQNVLLGLSGDRSRVLPPSSLPVSSCLLWMNSHRDGRESSEMIEARSNSVTAGADRVRVKASGHLMPGV